MMSGRERVLAAIRGDPVDRVPLAQDNAPFAARYTGLTMREFSVNPEKAAQAFVDTAYDFKHDCIIVGFDTAALAEAMGAEVESPEDEPMRVSGPAVKSLRDVPSLPVPNPLTDGRLPLI